MTIHMATPSEIGGSLDESEVKVLHVTGPFQGMLVVNKLDDHTLDDAIADGQVMVQEGAVVVPTPPGTINVAIMATTGVGLENPPLSYPINARMDLRPSPGVSPDWTSVRVRAVKPDGTVLDQNIPVENWGGAGVPGGPFVIASYPIDGPGEWNFTFTPPTNHRATQSLNMLPAFTVTGITPNPVLATTGRTDFTIHGTGFDATTEARFDGNPWTGPGSVTLVSPTEIIFSADPSAELVNPGSFTINVRNGPTSPTRNTTLTVT
jgi:hypothetical protein